jgi:hypothetical protein
MARKGTCASFAIDSMWKGIFQSSHLKVAFSKRLLKEFPFSVFALALPGRTDSAAAFSTLRRAENFRSCPDSIRIGVAISSLLLFVPHVSNIGIQELILGDSQRRPPHLSALKSRVKAKTKKRSFYLLQRSSETIGSKCSRRIKIRMAELLSEMSAW